MLLPASAYYNSNPKNYFRCKLCEGKRHQDYRERHHHENNGQLCCPNCREPATRALLNDKKSLHFVFYACPQCERNIRFRRCKDNDAMEFSNGTIQCYHCLKYGCTKAGKCCLDKNAEKNSDNTLSGQLDAIFNLLL